MKAHTSLSWVGIGMVALTALPSVSFAQRGAFGGGYGPPLKDDSAAEGIRNLRGALRVPARAGEGRHEAHARDGAALGRPVEHGRQHAHGRVHRGPGLQGGKVREGVLTPEYEKAYKERWRQQTEKGEVHYDRLAHCEPPGYAALPARAVHARVHQSAERVVSDQRLRPVDTPRAYRQGARNLYGTHSWYGDTIGFWDGDKLVMNTKYLLPRRLHALVADDEQPVRDGRDLAAQEVRRRHRAARGAGHVLRQVRVREAGERRVRVSSRDATSRKPTTA